MVFEPPVLTARLNGVNGVRLTWLKTSPQAQSFTVEYCPAVLRNDTSMVEWLQDERQDPEEDRFWQFAAFVNSEGENISDGGEIVLREVGPAWQIDLVGFGFGWLYSFRVQQRDENNERNLDPIEDVTTVANVITRVLTPIVNARITYVRSRKAYVTIQKEDWHLFEDPPFEKGDFLPWFVTFKEENGDVVEIAPPGASFALSFQKGSYASPTAPTVTSDSELNTTYFHWEVFSADSATKGFTVVTSVELAYSVNWSQIRDPSIDFSRLLTARDVSVSLPENFGSRFIQDLGIGQFFKTSVSGRSVVELYHFLNLATNASIRLANERIGVNVIFDGITYWGTEMEAEGFEYKGEGTLPRPKITFKLPKVGHPLMTLSSIQRDFFFAEERYRIKVTRIRTLVRFLDARNWGGIDNLPGGWTPNPGKRFPDEIFYIDRLAGINQATMEIELATAMDLEGVSLPKRLCLSRLCSWEYKGSECGYTGSIPTCEKTLTDCRSHFGEGSTLPYGGFPALGNVA